MIANAYTLGSQVNFNADTCTQPDHVANKCAQPDQFSEFRIFELT